MIYTRKCNSVSNLNFQLRKARSSHNVVYVSHHRHSRPLAGSEADPREQTSYQGTIWRITLQSLTPRERCWQPSTVVTSRWGSWLALLLFDEERKEEVAESRELL